MDETNASHAAACAPVRTEMLTEFERAVRATLETYSNVHRGSGQHSRISTSLYEKAREGVLAHFGLDKRKYTVVFCTPRRAQRLMAQLQNGRYRIASSADLGLPLGLRALAVERGLLNTVTTSEAGGGTARLVAPGWVVWARSPERFEAGTPAIVNVIAFARALEFVEQVEQAPLTTESATALSVEQILFEDELEHRRGLELLSELRRTLIGRGAQVPTAHGSRRYVNLDNAASTRTFMPVWNAAWNALNQTATVQRQVVEAVKTVCADFVQSPSSDYDIVFTSNTTEAINLVAESLAEHSRAGTEPLVVNTILEHNSNELPWRRPGLSVIRVPVDLEGFIDLVALDTTLRSHRANTDRVSPRPILVAVSGSSNVLGTFNDLGEISRIVHSHGAHLLVDAAQLIAHRPVSMLANDIDYLAFSAHKAYAPFGTGVLIARKGLLGFEAAELERIRASGEENVVGIAALGKALLLLQRIGFDVVQEEERTLTALALQGLPGVDGLEIHGVQTVASPRFARRGGVIAFSIKGMMGPAIASALADRAGIGIRYGCHCAHLLVKHVLHLNPFLQQAQWLIAHLAPRLEFPGVARVSLGLENTAEDVDALLTALTEITRARRGASNATGSRDPRTGDTAQSR